MHFKPYMPESAALTFKYDFASHLLGAGVAAVAPIGAVVARKALGASDFEIALIHSATFMGYFMSLLAAGPSSGGRKMAWAFWPRFIGHGLLVLVVFATSSMLFTAVFTISNAVMQMSLPATTGIYSSNYPEKSRGRIVSLLKMTETAFLVLFTFLGGLVMNEQPWTFRILFPLAGVLGVAGAVVFSRIRVNEPGPCGVNDVEGDQSGPRIGLRSILSVFGANRIFAVFMATWFLFGFANIMTRPALTIYYVDPEFGVNADYFQLSLLTAIIPNAIMFATVYFWGRIYDRVDVIKLRGILQLVWSLELLICFLTNRIEFLYVSVAIRGFAAAGSSLIWNIGVIRFAPPREVPLYMGIHTFLTGVRGIIAPHVGIFIKAAAGVHAVFIIGFAAMLVAGFWESIRTTGAVEPPGRRGIHKERSVGAAGETRHTKAAIYIHPGL